MQLGAKCCTGVAVDVRNLDTCPFVVHADDCIWVETIVALVVVVVEV